jgi:cell division transport system permease protein
MNGLLRAVSPGIRETWDGLVRHPALTLLATLSIGTTLYVLGLFLLLAFNLDQTSRTLARELRVHLYLKPGVSGEAVADITSMLAGDPAVLEAHFIPEKEARALFAAQFPGLGDLPAEVGGEIFPPSFELELRREYQDADAVERLIKVWGKSAGVDEVRYDRGWFERLAGLLELIRSGGYGLGGLLLLAVMVTVGAVVRLTVMARREEIEIMKLVGATTAFVRAPFLAGAMVQGLAGGILATAAVRLTWGLLVGSEAYHENPFMALAAGRFPGTAALAILPVAGALLGIAAAALSLRRAATA